MAEVGSLITAGISFIARQQRPDGGFDGLASADQAAFSKPQLHPTIFFTALIAQCCSELPGSAAIARKSVVFLLAHKSPVWSWNYWQRDELGQHMQGYPDDLDDTACALTAVITHDRSLLTGTVLGHIGRQLVTAETKVGGPYQTWLVPPAELTTWGDIDVAVNANIAGMLSCLGAMPSGLEDYLFDALRQNKLTSSYYLGIIPALYFLARTGERTYSRLLDAKIKLQLQKDPATRNPLMNALLLSAASRAGYNKVSLAPLARALQAARTTDHWPACALYVEPPINDVAYYAGSAALTTAFACEALALLATLGADSPTKTPSQLAKSRPIAWREAQHFANTISQPHLQSRYLVALEAIADRDTDSQISALAQHFSHDNGKKISRAALIHLDIASINGWIAYTLYDDILDGEANATELLGTANLALRECVEHFKLALPQNRGYQQLVSAALMLVDEANTWEYACARVAVQNNVLIIATLPDYTDFAQLAERSWGHILASSGVLIAAGYKSHGVELRSWQLFFHHFLIARQLNDDAHDWQEDLAAGRLSAAVCLLLKDFRLPYKIDLRHDLVNLRQHFWQHSAPEICDLIDRQLHEAETALKQCNFLTHSQRYQTWLTKLTAAVSETRRKRQEALDFIASFEAI